MAQATDSHHATLGELVPAQVSCWREGKSGGNPPAHTSEDEGGACGLLQEGLDTYSMLTLAGGTWPGSKVGGGCCQDKGWKFPTSEQFLVGTDCADTYLLVDDIHPAKAGGRGRDALRHTRTYSHWESPGAQARPTLFSACPKLTPPLVGAAPGAPPQSPHL